MLAKGIDPAPRLSTLRALAPYLIAVASTAVAAVLTWAVWPVNNNVIAALFYPAVFVSAFYGSRLAAMLAVALSALGIYYLCSALHDIPAAEQAYVLITFGVSSSLFLLVIERVKTNTMALRAREESLAREHDQETLREQAELLDEAQRVGRMGTWNLDLRTGRLACPEATLALFGVTRSQFTGAFQQFRSFILPEDVAAYDAAAARVTPSNPVFEAQYRIRRPDGAVRWMHSRGHLETDATGTPIGRIGVVMDMTEQHAAGERLAETVALLRIAGRVAHLGGWTIQLPGRELTWSDETCTIHDLPAGYQPTFDEGVGYYPPAYREEVLRHVNACERDGTSYDFEVPKMTATGRQIWVRSIGEAVRDADGRIVGLQGAFQDISTRRRAEQALRDSEAEFRALAESMPQMVWMTRADGWNTYTNQRWVDYTGLSLEDTYGYGWSAPFHPDDRQRALDSWQQAMAGGDYNVECRLRAADGSYRWMLVRGLPLRDGEGRTLKWIGTCTDIDDLKQAQEASLRSESVQRALAADLAAERARLLTAQAVASIGSWETDLATLGVVWSAETHRIFETTPENFQPTHAGFLQLVHPEDRAAVDDAFARSLAHRSSGAIEHRLLMPDGRIKFVEERWRLVCNDRGEPVRAIGTCHDSTERRRAQDAIRTQAHMLDQIGQAVIATDIEGRVTYANRFAGELYGWAPGDMVGRLITEMIVPQATLSQGREIMARLQRGETWSGEFQVQTRQGRAFPAHITNSPVLDGRGQVVGIVGISTDITARKQAEDAARQKDALIRIAGRLTQTGGWAIELPGERVFWSDEVFDILQLARGNMPPLADGLAFYPSPWREKVVSAIEACRQDGTAFDFEAEVLTATGARKWVRLSAEAERDAAGAITRIQGAFQDRTEHKHLEQQYLRAQRMESIGLLAGGIAHDLNNVLAPILLSIGLLHEDEQSSARLETLATIEDSAKRGAAMVGRLLSFARGADGRREAVQVPPLIRDLAKIVRDTFPKNIAFEDHLSPDLWSLQADATQLHQLLLNLCVNARDAMPSGGQITLTAKNIDIDEAFAAMNIDAHSGPYVTLIVEDTGTGIPDAIIDKIFDPFFTTKAIGKGTGLGLATSLAIVTGHRGFMRASSSPSGTRFDVYLPAETTQTAPAALVPKVVHPHSTGETVLVIDDEAGIRLIARRILEKNGYRVLLAADGAEAIALYSQHQADIAVVLTDMMMPVMDGAATIQGLVALNPDVRIIAVSGLATDAKTAGGAAARVMHFLGKPYTADTLLSAIRAALPAGTTE